MRWVNTRRVITVVTDGKTVGNARSSMQFVRHPVGTDVYLSTIRGGCDHLSIPAPKPSPHPRPTPGLRFYPDLTPETLQEIPAPPHLCLPVCRVRLTIRSKDFLERFWSKVRIES